MTVVAGTREHILKAFPSQFPSTSSTELRLVNTPRRRLHPFPYTMLTSTCHTSPGKRVYLNRVGGYEWKEAGAEGKTIWWYRRVCRTDDVGGRV